MEHRHLTRDRLTLASIDSIIERGAWADWLRLARAIRSDPVVHQKATSLVRKRLARQNDEFFDRDIFVRWLTLCERQFVITNSVVRKSRQLGLSFPYDWSNPNIPDEALIIGVLKRGIFTDICRICIHFGLPRIKQVAADLPGMHHSLFRMLANISQGFANPAPKPATSPASDPESLFLQTSLAIHQRTRSKDLFVLMDYVKNGRSIGEILEAGPAADPACSFEYGKCVLIGDVPLDADDEGFDGRPIAEAYDFFKAALDDYEQTFANTLFCMRLSG